MGRAVDTHGAQRLVEEISDSVSRNPGAVISLARLKTADDYTFMHSVAVCALLWYLDRRERETRGLEPDYKLPDLILPGRPATGAPSQAEFVQVPADYVRETSIARLAGEGQRLMQKHRAALDAIEKQFGVPATIVLAIWGRETDYGRYALPHDTLPVVATQAWVGRRKDQ